MGLSLLQAGRKQDAMPVFEKTYEAYLTALSGLKSQVRILTPEQMPRIAHGEHLTLHLSRGRVEMFAIDRILNFNGSHLRRFPLLAALCKGAAKSIPDGVTAACIFDIGDGDESGDYHRFAMCAAKADATLLPDPYFFESNGYAELRALVARSAKPWEERKPIVFWRGSATGIRVGEPKTDSWEWLPRLAFCDKAKRIANSIHIDVAITQMAQIDEPRLRQAIAAAGLTGGPIAKEHFLNYRFLVDADGNTGSWGWFDKLVMGATSVKISSGRGFHQWFSTRLTPWTDFVPVATDLSDLDEIVGWLVAHPQEAKAIAESGRRFAEEQTFERVMLEGAATFFSGIMQDRPMPLDHLSLSHRC